MRASWAPQLLKGFGWGESLPPSSPLFFVHSVLKAKASTCAEQEKAHSYSGYKEKEALATITAPSCLLYCSPCCTTCLFCNPLLCFPSPPPKAQVSFFPLFWSSVLFLSFPSLLHFFEPAWMFHFWWEYSVPLNHTGSWEGRWGRLKAESLSLTKTLMGGTIFSEGLRRRRGRINLGLAQRVCPNLG